MIVWAILVVARDFFTFKRLSGTHSSTLIWCEFSGNLVDSVGVAANFHRMVRIADSTGIPYDAHESKTSKEIEEQLNLRRLATSQHTPG